MLTDPCTFYRTQVVFVVSDLWVRFSLTELARFADLTDVTLADEDTNSILADNANRAFQGNVAMRVIIGPRYPWSDLWVQASLTNKLRDVVQT